MKALCKRKGRRTRWQNNVESCHNRNGMSNNNKGILKTRTVLKGSKAGSLVVVYLD
jgi:hypothetical protein